MGLTIFKLSVIMLSYLRGAEHKNKKEKTKQWQLYVLWYV